MEQCQVITPFGSFTAIWADDEEQRVRYEGSLDAIEFFRSWLEANPVSGADGARLQFATIEPGDIRGFCNHPDAGLVVEPDLDSEVLADE